VRLREGGTSVPHYRRPKIDRKPPDSWKSDKSEERFAHKYIATTLTQVGKQTSLRV
jgi:hypothetical protein